MDGLPEIFEENDIPVVMSGYPAMFSFALGVQAVTCQRDWDKSDRELYVRADAGWRSTGASCRTLTPGSPGSCATSTARRTLTRR